METPLSNQSDDNTHSASANKAEVEVTPESVEQKTKKPTLVLYETDEELVSPDHDETLADSDFDEDDADFAMFKVLVVGNARCGKTSVIKRYVEGTFSEKYSSTIGADFQDKDIDYDNQTRINLQLWDIAGQDRFAKLTRAYFRDAKGAIIVCDLTRENTVEAVMNWKKEIDTCCKDLLDSDNSTIPVILIANKDDLLENPRGAMDLGINMQKCVDSNGILEWFRASAKNGDKIEEAMSFLVGKMMENYLRSKSNGDMKENVDEDIIRLSVSQKNTLKKEKNDLCECN